MTFPPAECSMTEAEWLNGTDFTAHVRYAADRLSPRRLRLMAAGFCRALGDLLDHPELTASLAVVEWYADGRATAAELEKARQQCRVVAQEAYDAYARQVDGGASGGTGSVRHELAWVVSFAAVSPLPLVEVGNRAAAAAVQARTGVELMTPVASPAFDDATAEQALVMRAVVWDVAGRLFRPIAFAPEWRTDTAVALARHIYDSREFTAMPILADALQDAGCDSDEVLNHCRDADQIHVRGCWVVDGVLGKD